MTGSRNNWQIAAKFLVSIRYGAFEECRQLLLAGADSDQVFKINNLQTPALHVAVQLCAIDFVELLLANQCSVDQRDSKGRTALALGIEMGYERIAELLLLHRADVNLQDYQGQNSLHFAVKRGSIYLSRVLIERGANVSQKNSAGHTPLTYASNYELVKLLIENGAGANEFDDHGLSILWRILNSGSYNFKTIELLLQNGARGDLINESHKAPIHLIVLSNNNEKWKCLELILKNGCDVNLQTKEMQTPLHLAVQTQDLKAVRILLCAGANPNVIDILGASPLAYAFATRVKKIIFTLVNGGARINKNQINLINSDYFLTQEKQFLTESLTNPLKLTKLSRIAIWKFLGPNMMDWLNENENQLPAILVDFLQFETLD